MADKKKTPLRKRNREYAGQNERTTEDVKKQAIRDIRMFFIRSVTVVLLIWLLVGVIFGITVMNGEDMYPRIRDGDLMIYYRLQKEYHIGDVVTFLKEGRRYTGRIVAQSGDSVDMNEEGQLLINGNIQEEEIFYPTEMIGTNIDFPCHIPEKSVFLLCDFRTNGTDSRSYGPVEIRDLDGKVITILRRRGI